MPTSRTNRPAAAALAALTLVIAAACGSPGGGKTTSGARAEVLAVKIDNVAAARPPTGLEKADIVYVEQVEAGLSRILAAYSSGLPPVVGPVRSARETDLELLRQFDEPTLAYSGAQSALQPSIEAAPLDALPPSKAPDAYFRGGERAAPHNLYLRPGKVQHASTGVNAAEDIGLRFAAPPPGGTPVNDRSVSYPSARFTFTWALDRDEWLVSMDGTPARTSSGDRLAAATVVLQNVDVQPSRFRDRGGNTSPFSATVGSGSAVVLRDGKSYDVTWQRDTAESATGFTTRDGKPMTFATGQVWIVLLPN
ncbi:MULTISPECIES: DUF3048 domain-containing protein [unclassified Streptomyces]|uniref:DUF3048 domain-containing protein n=1 Tax=unclassified Streptomyces TaxID=2593676 RepID=UPI002E147502|nr:MULTISPECIES: DUF3048 domain-containing protein [unclassified Streptomyces]WSQ89432.1 DUF3048 domain-containing protein [Streptomyces sp. NBC_01212]WSR46176.1 DUF3048 domain-containing protein [Streptomyces sp. NBC_01201]